MVLLWKVHWTIWVWTSKSKPFLQQSCTRIWGTQLYWLWIRITELHSPLFKWYAHHIYIYALCQCTMFLCTLCLCTIRLTGIQRWHIHCYWKKIVDGKNPRWLVGWSQVGPAPFEGSQCCIAADNWEVIFKFKSAVHYWQWLADSKTSNRCEQ